MHPLVRLCRQSLRPLLLSVCVLTGAHAQDTPHAETLQAQAQWQAADIKDYQFTLTHHCFCMGENHGAMRVRVANGVVHSATWVNNGQPVSADALTQVPTIGGIFQKIDAAYAQNAQSIRLRLNPQHGYPEHVFVDYDKRMADEELVYSVGHFSPAPRN